MSFKRLSILHVNTMLTGGGTDDSSVRIAHSLGKLGHEVRMAGPDGREFSQIARELGLRFHPVPTRGFLKLPLVFKLAELLKREKIQIIHARHGRDYWPSILAARLAGNHPRIVLTRHLAKSPNSWISRRFLLQNCDAMVGVSNFVAKVLREGDADPESDNPDRHLRLPMQGDLSKIRMIYGGFDIDRFKPADAAQRRAAWGLKDTDYAFAVVGVYNGTRGKGQPEFLQAAARITKDCPNARFLMVGRGDMTDLLQEQIVQLGLKASAWLTPYSHDMPAAMNAMDCMVIPAVGTEAFGGVVCEAHACGKPVIASNLDGIPEAFNVGGYGSLYERGSLDGLSRAMATWRGRPPLDLAERWKLHDRVAERCSLERAASDLSALYESLVSQP